MMSRSARRFVVALFTSLALVLGLAPSNAPPAQAAPLFGHDVSWPQCPSSQGGFGLPMPPPSSQFIIIGLTKGLAFTENPCLASQVTWARTNGKPSHGYAMATFPTAAQLSTYRSQGPWSSSTRAGQLSNVGYSEARFAVASMNRIGFRPPVVWIDVEPRPAQPWPTGTAQRERENRWVIEGLMRGLRDAGFSYGFYSYTSGWQEITGSWRVPGVPVWATAGRLDYPNEALDRCTQASFSGGRVYISQWYDDTRDYNRTCDPYAFTPLAIPASTLSGPSMDFNGDWNHDILARARASGDLRNYAGTGRGSLLQGAFVGRGWGIYNTLHTPGDLTSDGAGDILVRDAIGNGNLWLYRGTGKGGHSARAWVGGGWDPYTIVAPGDFNGDQRADLLARERANGVLWLYPGNGAGGWFPRVRVGGGWNPYTMIGPGDFNGDGTADILAREDATGSMWLYPGNGRGGWLPRSLVGGGWKPYSIAAPGDFNGDRTADVVARDSGGSLWLYPGNGRGGLLPRLYLGGGWWTIDAIF
ncbi:hypothetical protein BJ994_002521 [Arthrobacter pigmenti]|uniref:Uncharacterized protein n=1 Tax=Arthrobacter pigmenti TaxID=271432 RepID=A0A846RUZ7_9MICC|nr:FG-GAP-like repeat-containing protein [Arthrobacter pigmenti]NJC23445.1 hypothetical protein [Arthrobacter pigmenti]